MDEEDLVLLLLVGFGLWWWMGGAGGTSGACPVFDGCGFPGGGCCPSSGASSSGASSCPSAGGMPVSCGSQMLTTFCTAIRDMEGGPGSLNYRNNNPGNIRCASSYDPMYGTVRCVNGFAVFPTYQQGWAYLQNYVLAHIAANPGWTFYDFFNMYAPSSDSNNPSQYAGFVAGRCGVDPSTVLSMIIGPAIA